MITPFNSGRGRRAPLRAGSLSLSSGPGPTWQLRVCSRPGFRVDDDAACLNDDSECMPGQAQIGPKGPLRVPPSTVTGPGRGWVPDSESLGDSGARLGVARACTVTELDR